MEMVTALRQISLEGKPKGSSRQSNAIGTNNSFFLQVPAMAWWPRYPPLLHESVVGKEITKQSKREGIRLATCPWT